MDVIKWELNFVSCKLDLKSYLWFQITRSISDQIALHSVQLPLKTIKIRIIIPPICHFLILAFPFLKYEYPPKITMM